MNANDLTIESGWQQIGRITVERNNGTLTMPQGIPDTPGLYLLKFDNGRIYVGEAADLQRRIGDYIVYYEATGIESEFRINRALHEYGGAEVFIYVGDDVKSRSERCIVEHRLIKSAGESALNGGTAEDKIAFRLTKKLNRRASNGGRNE